VTIHRGHRLLKRHLRNDPSTECGKLREIEQPERSGAARSKVWSSGPHGRGYLRMCTKRFLVLLLASNVLLSLAPLLFGISAKAIASESSPITLLSFAQLVASSIICWKVFRVRCPYSKPRLDTPQAVWAIMAAGFLFLSIDEAALVHERLDFLIHTVFGIRETGVSDRLDDVIIAAYGLFGIVVLWKSRSELVRFRRVLPLIAIGFAFMFLMVALDMVTNRNDVLPLFIRDPSAGETLAHWLNLAEEVFKLLAEAMFLGGFYECLQMVARAKPSGKLRCVP
jgi:hypothetical protein